jgi:DNA-binding NarL/FixJ family response regulator
MRRERAVRLLIDSKPVAEAARRALAEDPAPNGARWPVDVIAWPGAPLGEQRRRLREAVAKAPDRRIVLITELEERSAIQRLVGEGAHGLVLTAEIDAALAVTVRAVGSGQLCVTARARQGLAPRALSARERQILALVIMGLPNGEIARRLHVAESTVKSHLVSTFAKLGVRSRAEATEIVSDPQEMLSTGVLGFAGRHADDPS